jgi:3D (Asp-Asp-Asp) domain-containing protein
MTTFLRVGLVALMVWPWVATSDEIPDDNSLFVIATAYNSVEAQTDGDPNTAAWGDRLQPGMKAIAVSRDLLEMGLDHRAPVRIDGLPGEYVVLDKMNRRWHKRIDIYMGEDIDAARQWGRRNVRIFW